MHNDNAPVDVGELLQAADRLMDAAYSAPDGEAFEKHMVEARSAIDRATILNDKDLVSRSPEEWRVSRRCALAWLNEIERLKCISEALASVGAWLTEIPGTRHDGQSTV